MNNLNILMVIIQLCVIESVWSLDEARNNHGTGGVIVNQLVDCGGTSRSRVTNIQSPDPVTPGPCTYTIKPFSHKYCQIRVNIVNINLADPTPGTATCETDTLTIGTAAALCGSDNNQHVIEDFPANGQIVIVIDTDPRPGTPLPPPIWELDVEQIRCGKRHNNNNNNVLNNRNLIRSFVVGGSGGRLLKNDEDEIEEDVMDDESKTFEGRNNHNGNVVLDDGPEAGGPAPAGCLQYFTRRTGTVESFNFNNGRGTYIANMKYAICFQRRRGDTAIQFTPSFFEMGYAGPSNDTGRDANCYSEVATQGRSEDHLYIPFGVVNTPPATRASRFCGTYLASTTITSNAPGPFIIYFNSDNVVDPNKPEVGFRLQYTII